MTIDAHISVYIDEFVPAFERSETKLRGACFTKTNINGKTAVFLVSGTPTAVAKERGANGQFVARQNSNTQNSCVLKEIYDLLEGTKFTWDLSQADQRMIAAQSAAKCLYRKMEDQITDQLDTASVTQTAAVASLEWAQDALSTLAEANVPTDNEDDLFGLMTPRAMRYLVQIPEFSSADYVETKSLDGNLLKYKRWAGLNWIEHNGLTGRVTSQANCFFFHRNAIGHACQTSEMVVDAGFERKQQTYWSLATAWCEAKLLQDSGVVLAYHTDS